MNRDNPANSARGHFDRRGSLGYFLVPISNSVHSTKIRKYEEINLGLNFQVDGSKGSFNRI